MSDLNVIWPVPGRYVLAVSGGADSMVLLDLFAGAAKARGYELIVAHFDHGLRPESSEDAAFVAVAAQAYGLPYETARASLSSHSEAAARHARHTWLEQVRLSCGATAILTAHHQDDLIETSLLNLARGTGRLGLAPMLSGGSILRPLLSLGRADLRTYAASRNIDWREDTSNADISNARNLVRHRLLPYATPAWRENYLQKIADLSALNADIAQQLGHILTDARVSPEAFAFDRSYFQSLSTDEAAEILIAAARTLRPGIQLDSPLIKSAAQFALTGAPHKRRPLRQGLEIKIDAAHIRLATKSPH